MAMKRHDPATVLRTYVQAHGGSQKQAAERLGMSESYLSDLLHGKRRCSDAVLAAIGLERVIVRKAARA
jgi:transcriptional regulator with XRE-family HTH domain